MDITLYCLNHNAMRVRSKNNTMLGKFLVIDVILSVEKIYKRSLALRTQIHDSKVVGKLSQH